jgi:hypothetical protein
LAASSKSPAAGKKPGFSVSPAVGIVGVLVLLGAAAFWYLDRASKQPPSPPPPLTAEAKSYIGNLQLGDVDMKAHESYLKQSVVEITGQIGNTGGRNLAQITLTCVFYDMYGQIVLRERVPIVTRKGGGLAAGARKPFRLAFDNIPGSWNQVLPQLVIAGIDFSGA